MVSEGLRSRFIGLLFAVARISAVSATATHARDANAAAAKCRFLPQDSGWPSAKEWQKLNESVSGNLIAAIPLGHVCHDPAYDADACAALRAGWVLPQTQ